MPSPICTATRAGAINAISHSADQLFAARQSCTAAMVCLGMPTCTISGSWLGDAPVQYLHMVHRVFGVIVGIVTTIAEVQLWRAAKSWSALRLIALIAPALVAVQIGLGIYTVMTMRSVPVAVAHFAGAVSLWALWLSALLITRSRASIAGLAPPYRQSRQGSPRLASAHDSRSMIGRAGVKLTGGERGRPAESSARGHT